MYYAIYFVLHRSWRCMTLSRADVIFITCFSPCLLRGCLEMGLVYILILSQVDCAEGYLFCCCCFVLFFVIWVLILVFLRLFYPNQSFV